MLDFTAFYRVLPATAFCLAVFFPGGALSEESRSLHDRAFVVDLHVDTGMAIDKGLVLSRRNKICHADLPRLREGGVDAFVAISFVSPNTVPKDEWWNLTVSSIKTIRAQVEEFGGQARVCASASQARDVARSGRIAVVLGVEGGHVLDDRLSRLDDLYDLGVRVLVLTWSTGPGWATPSDVPASGEDDPGLSDFGREVVRRCNDLGIVIDVSHASPKTVDDVLAVSRHPIMASHSACRALHDHHRNLDDDRIRTIARSGGVVGVPVHPPFLTDRSASETTVSDIADHFDYLRAVGGASVCALGTDFDGIPEGPSDMPDVTHLPHLTDELVRRGWSEEDITTALGRNAARVFATVCP